MEIFRIVLTGGPCAGKTTILNNVKDDLRKKKIPCLIVPEVATQLIEKGFNPADMDTFDFQSAILNRQLYDEAENKKFIDYYKDDIKKLVIIYDRGIYDNKAYFNETSDFYRLLDKFKLDDMQTLDGYDMVLDLLSVATCKPKAYTLNNNQARRENTDVARALDKKTSNVWANHRNMKLVSSEVSVEEETKNVLRYIYDFINERNVIETYRFFVDEKNSDVSMYDQSNLITINDVFLKIDDNSHIYRLSERIGNGKSYVLDSYVEFGNKRLLLSSTRLSKEQYDELYDKYEHLKVESRKELSFVDNELLCRLCYYDNSTVLEVQRNDFNEIRIPENIKVLNDFENAIIEDSRNVSIAKKLLCS